MQYSSQPPTKPTQPYGYYGAWKPIGEDVKPRERVVLNDKLSIFWEYQYAPKPLPSHNNYNGYLHLTEVCLVVKDARGNETTYRNLDEWGFSTKHPVQWNAYEKALDEYRARCKKLRARELAKERRERIKTEAEQAGIPLKEYQENLRKLNREKRCSGMTKADVKETEKRILFSSYLAQLKREVDISLKKAAEEDSKSINLIYMNRKIELIKVATNMLLEANRGKDK